jgi:hypothetical protein
LKQILRIKKVGLLKQWMSHLRGTGIKGAGRLQGFAFGFGITRHKCKYKYAAYSHVVPSCQGSHAAISTIITGTK